MTAFLLGIVTGFLMAAGSAYLLSWMFSGNFYSDIDAWKKKWFGWLLK